MRRCLLLPDRVCPATPSCQNLPALTQILVFFHYERRQQLLRESHMLLHRGGEGDKDSSRQGRFGTVLKVAFFPTPIRQPLHPLKTHQRFSLI